jgi:hypothetical protein
LHMRMCICVLDMHICSMCVYVCVCVYMGAAAREPPRAGARVCVCA